jgi:hypothetical protein
MDLYNKLLRCGIFRASPNIRAFHDKKKVQLDPDTTLLYENGIAFGKYLDVLKTLLVRRHCFIYTKTCHIYPLFQNIE